NTSSKSTCAYPMLMRTHMQLGGLSTQVGKWQEVLDNTKHVLELDPAGTIKIWYYNALANFQLSKDDPAETAAGRALALDPSHTVPNLEQLVAVLLAKKGNYSGALAHLRNCLTYLPAGADADFVKQQI